MTNATRLLTVSVLSIAAAACGKANSAPKGEPCDAAALTALKSSLDKANGIGVDLTDKSLEKEREAMKAQVTGKRYTFKGCTFYMQGNDEVSFGAQATDVTLGCVMKGGEAGVKAFRKEAMKIENMDKLRLDVSGVIALNGSKGFERLKLTDCQISTHQ